MRALTNVVIIGFFIFFKTVRELGYIPVILSTWTAALMFKDIMCKNERIKARDCDTCL
jgi:hypothetical protein